MRSPAGRALSRGGSRDRPLDTTPTAAAQRVVIVASDRLARELPRCARPTSAEVSTITSGLRRFRGQRAATLNRRDALQALGHRWWEVGQVDRRQVVERSLRTVDHESSLTRMPRAQGVFEPVRASCRGLDQRVEADQQRPPLARKASRA